MPGNRSFLWAPSAVSASTRARLKGVFSEPRVQTSKQTSNLANHLEKIAALSSSGKSQVVSKNSDVDGKSEQAVSSVASDARSDKLTQPESQQVATFNKRLNSIESSVDLILQHMQQLSVAHKSRKKSHVEFADDVHSESSDAESVSSEITDVSVDDFDHRQKLRPRVFGDFSRADILQTIQRSRDLLIPSTITHWSNVCAQNEMDKRTVREGGRLAAILDDLFRALDGDRLALELAAFRTTLFLSGLEKCAKDRSLGFDHLDVVDEIEHNYLSQNVQKLMNRGMKQMAAHRNRSQKTTYHYGSNGTRGGSTSGSGSRGGFSHNPHRGGRGGRGNHSGTSSGTNSNSNSAPAASSAGASA